jgi:hypothetical protein
MIILKECCKETAERNLLDRANTHVFIDHLIILKYMGSTLGIPVAAHGYCASRINRPTVHRM